MSACYLAVVKIDRREFLIYATAAMIAAESVFQGPLGANTMYGLIVKMTIVQRKRDEMIRVLQESAAGMPGCYSYVVAKDATDENVLWVTEVWDSQASHDASLSLPAVKNAIPQGRALVSNFEKIATTTPIWGVGLPRV